MSDSIHSTEGTTCPVCEAKLNRAGTEDGRAGGPKPGDNSVCMYCASLLRFEPGLTLRRLELHELMEMSKEERDELGEVQWRIRHFRAGRLN